MASSISEGAETPGIDERTRDLRARVAALMDSDIYPAEATFARLGHRSEGARELMRALQQKAKAAGLWAPQLAVEAGGTGVGFMPYAYLCEIIGRSLVAPEVFNTQAPDAGNMEILWQFGTPEQHERFLAPLVRGDVRSSVSMTEPENSGSDPTGLQTRAVRDGDEWVINGHKWFTTGGEDAAFAIVMVASELDKPPHSRMTQIIVPADTPGFKIVRAVGVMGDTDGSHCEIIYDNVRVPVTNTLGEPGMGFRIAQRRLGPGRIHHCMRWLGQMQRAFDLMVRYSLVREAYGSTLAEKQTVQNWIADSYMEIQAARLLTLDAARKIDAGDEARVDISAIKVFGAKVLHDVIDRAIQVHGARGVSEDTPLAKMYREARFARIYDGPDESHRMVVSRQVLKTYREGKTWDFDTRTH